MLEKQRIWIFLPYDFQYFPNVYNVHDFFSQAKIPVKNKDAEGKKGLLYSGKSLNIDDYENG